MKPECVCPHEILLSVFVVVTFSTLLVLAVTMLILVTEEVKDARKKRRQEALNK